MYAFRRAYACARLGRIGGRRGWRGGCTSAHVSGRAVYYAEDASPSGDVKKAPK